MTYSIAAYDPINHQFGIAVQSHSFACGSQVPWVESGVGAIATQAKGNSSFGYLGLAMLRVGLSATQALNALLASDSEAEIRQVAIVDSGGNVAVHTGRKCIPFAEHQIGAHYSVQVNLMERHTVCRAIAEAFEAKSGDLAERMLTALRAAQVEGGDIRGQQSAALKVVSAQAFRPWERVFDLRIDDHVKPIAELERLLRIARSSHHQKKAIEFLKSDRISESFQEFQQAVQLLDDDAEATFWYAVRLAAANVEAATPLFQKLFVKDSRWRSLAARLVQDDSISDDLLDRILKI